MNEDLSKFTESATDSNFIGDKSVRTYGHEERELLKTMHSVTLTLSQACGERIRYIESIIAEDERARFERYYNPT